MPAMRVIRTNFARQEARRDRRYPIAVFEVVIGDTPFRLLNWSMTGLLLEGLCPGTEAGQRVAGKIRMPGSPPCELAFAASVVRTDPESGRIAIRFDEMGHEGIDFLDRAIARRLH